MKYEGFMDKRSLEGMDFLPVGSYAWDQWRLDLGRQFSTRLPIYFLHHKLIRLTMVHGGTQFQCEKLAEIERAYSQDMVRLMLKENVIGLPEITSWKYGSSANTIHQVFHCSSYLNNTGKNLFDSNSIIEWGGGYGCLARIYRTINANGTYVILDLPEMNALQYVYLSAIFGREEVVFQTDKIDVVKGKINLICSDYYLSSNAVLVAETFISNWALTESGSDYQAKVVSADYFGASNILVSCIEDENNNIVTKPNPFEKKVPIEVLGDSNYYLMK
jgi:hypothetical protein